MYILLGVVAILSIWVLIGLAMFGVTKLIRQGRRLERRATIRPDQPIGKYTAYWFFENARFPLTAVFFELTGITEIIKAERDGRFRGDCYEAIEERVAQAILRVRDAATTLQIGRNAVDEGIEIYDLTLDEIIDAANEATRAVLERKRNGQPDDGDNDA